MQGNNVKANSHRTTILIVDDDSRIRNLLGKFLQTHNFEVQLATNVAQARSYLAVQPFDLMILDVMMQGESGIEFLKKLQNAVTPNIKQIPVIFLTARDEMPDKILGLSIGADDYITKPFEPEELLARIKTILKRVNLNVMPLAVLSLGSFHFDLEKGTLLKRDIEIRVSSTELILLRTLAQKPFHPFSRSDLAHRIGYMVSERSIDVQITRLRHKINDNPPKYLQTIRHVGYALCPD